MKKSMKIVSNFITILLFLLLIFMVYIVISSKIAGGEPQFLGYQLKTVLSGSMEPTFKTGSIIAIKPVSDPASLKKKDVITFMESDNKLVTHRIVEVNKDGNQTMYKTKGDNNQDPDANAVLSQNVVGKYTGFTVPYAGYLIDFAKSKQGISLLLILPGIILLAYSGVTIFKAVKELDKGREKELKDGHETI
ncbi:signal peptidase I SipW [Bacillus sp. 1NLA3E]|uniref:signal peptidase I SipW n=1 Tax=Bacillus sp. 1NLA3E TaxID=666686 RepID=UPI000247E89C|nr:signal peptidase I [Bacillus sp. 1NLA3E]AGK53326.1 signal peptidase I [Bacillus sp. 1NLA3E]